MPFGIRETHLMYELGANEDCNSAPLKCFDFGSGPEPYRDAGSGPHTHYLDNSHPQATDNANIFGSPAKPRVTIPAGLRPGSVVEIHGGASNSPYNTTTAPDGTVRATGYGTAAQPIFIRGYDFSDQPRFSRSLNTFYGGAAYMILENINVVGFGFIGPQNGEINTHHMALRNSTVEGTPSGGGIGIVSWTVAPDFASRLVHDIVVYANVIKNNGDVDADFDQDVHGVGVGTGTSNIWILDNEMTRNSGDGVQINGFGSADPVKPHHIYVGRNTSHHNKQSGMWTKTAHDIIFSENTSFDHRPSDSSDGAGMGFQYAPENVWFIYNHIYDTTCGICSGSNSTTYGDNVYIVGNLIHDVHVTGAPRPFHGWHPAAIMMAGGNRVRIVGNTIHDADAGINSPTRAAFGIHNNIFSNITNDMNRFIQFDFTPSLLTISNNLFYSPEGTVKIAVDNTGFSPEALLDTKGIGQNTFSDDPLFNRSGTDDYTLAPASPAAGKALAPVDLAENVYQKFIDLYGINIQKDILHQPIPTSDGNIGALQ